MTDRNRQWKLVFSSFSRDLARGVYYLCRRLVTEGSTATGCIVINRLFMKLSRTSDIQVVAQCQEEFSFDLPSVQLARRRKKFLDKLYHCHSV